MMITPGFHPGVHYEEGTAPFHLAPRGKVPERSCKGLRLRQREDCYILKMNTIPQGKG